MLGAWEPGGEAPASATTVGKADVDLGTVVNSPIRVQPVVESTRRPGVASPGKESSLTVRWSYGRVIHDVYCLKLHYFISLSRSVEWGMWEGCS